MNTRMIIACALLCVTGPALAQQQAATPLAVERIDGTAPDGTRFYQDTLTIDAPAATLFAAFTDADKYRGWSGVPVAAIDFRLGGVVEASYSPDGKIGDPQNVKNAFIAYIPDRLLVFRNVQAPDRLPGKDDYAKTVKTIEFMPLGENRTRVTVSGLGFGKGAGFDQLYAFFAPGDAAMLETLKKAMEPHEAAPPLASARDAPR